MTKQLNKTIRELKQASKSMSVINVDVISDCYHDDGYSIAVIRDKINSMIFDLESKYCELHRIGSHNMED